MNTYIQPYNETSYHCEYFLSIALLMVNCIINYYWKMIMDKRLSFLEVAEVIRSPCLFSCPENTTLEFLLSNGVR